MGKPQKTLLKPAITTQALIHLSTLGAFILPFLGIAVATAFFYLSSNPQVILTSIQVLNFNLTLIFLLALSYLFFVSIIGIPLGFALIIYCFFSAIIFPLRALRCLLNSNASAYPLTISFLSSQKNLQF